MYKEPPAAQARGLRDQSKGRRKVCLDLGVPRREQGPHGTCRRAGNIIGPVDSARRGALVREVPPAEEPAESAAKKGQCEMSHRSKERDEYAIRAIAVGGWPEVE